MIAIVDYGLGNIQAFANIYKRLDIPVTFAQRRRPIWPTRRRSSCPGVGAFDRAMERLQGSGMRERARRAGARARSARCSASASACRCWPAKRRRVRCRAWAGSTARCDASTKSRSSGSTRLPHMGWNDVAAQREQDLFDGLERQARFYFLHSYYFAPHDPADVLATDRLRRPLRLRVRRGNVFGVQFHPEKSHQLGHPAAEELRRDSECCVPESFPACWSRTAGWSRPSASAQPKYVGDPINAVRIFNEKEVDELMVLDIDATSSGTRARLRADRATSPPSAACRCATAAA